MNRMRPQYIKILGKGKTITERTKVNCNIPILLKMVQQLEKSEASCESEFSSIHFAHDIPKSIKERVEKELDIPFIDNEEGFVIDVGDDIGIYSPSDRGLFYGFLSLLPMMKGSYVDRLLAYDYPVCPERGLKVYLPSKENVPYFKELIDMLCYFKYNTIMIEVGGAMEYKRHPEINEGWVEYCKEMSEYSGKTTKIQNFTYPWYKNSIHVENGGGNFLSQSTVKELVEYCRERMLEVIPEVPSLSHCDYLMLNHHEIAERKEDPYPDTYCPSNPKSYELLFDVLDEVIEVFKPSIINIGHDEYYSIGVCEKCKDKKAEEILAEDIKKIHGYLSKQGIRTMIWGDKLLKDVYIKGAGPFGGAETKMYFPAWHYGNGEPVGMIPATYKAIDLIPRDVKILHWNWSLGGELENQFLERGFDIVYGNFEGHQFPNWNTHIRRGVKGAIISNWSTLSETILQRNGILFGIVYSYFMFWDKEYDDSMYNEVRDRTLEELFQYKYKNILAPAKAGDDRALVHSIEFLHSTDYKIKYHSFVDGVFVESEKYHLGRYAVEYEDGTVAFIPIIYGENISGRDVSWERKLDEDGLIYQVDDHLIEVSLTTLPVPMEDGTYYRFIWPNPYPNKRIVGITVEKNSQMECDIFLKKVKLL